MNFGLVIGDAAPTPTYYSTLFLQSQLHFFITDTAASFGM